MRFQRYVPGQRLLKQVYWDLQINQFGGVDVVPVNDLGAPILSRDPALISITPQGVIARPFHENDELEAIGVKVLKDDTASVFSIGDVGVIATASEWSDKD